MFKFPTTIVPSAILSVVIASSATSAVAIVPSSISAETIDSSSILAELTEPSARSAFAIVPSSISAETIDSLTIFEESTESEFISARDTDPLTIVSESTVLSSIALAVTFETFVPSPLKAVAVTVPTTSNSEDGFAVPIPTRPLPLIVILVDRALSAAPDAAAVDV